MKKLLLCALLTLALLFGCQAFASPVTQLSDGTKPDFPESSKLLKVYFINTHGASDAILLTYDGQSMLIDCGDTNYGLMYVKPLLDNLGIDHVDYAFNTHPHDDHINGFLSLLDRVSIGRFYTAFPFSYCAEQTNVLKAAMAHGVEIVNVDNESDISFGELKIWLYQDAKFLTPIAAKANSASMIIHITLGNSTVMITGDAEKPVFSDMYAEKGDAIQADIIKIPHHGYNTPSYEVFKVIGSKFAVITNYYNERLDDSSQFLRNNACQILYTGRGTVEAVTDGTRWTIGQLTDR